MIRLPVLFFIVAMYLTGSVVHAQHTALNGVKSVERAVIVPGLGSYSRKISTKNPLAQKFFDQGLSLTYGYYFPEAIASFQEALRHDPDNPIIEWGLAFAIGPNPNSRKNGFPDDPQGEGRKVAAAARSHLKRAAKTERALVRTLSVLYDVNNFPDRDVRDDEYIAATKTLVSQFSNDPEANFMYVNALMTRAAWNYWKRDGSAQPGTREAQATLEHILKLSPRHPGAVHLYIHLFESSSEPQRALPQANLLESLMPKAGHIVHMPSHIYVRVGQYEKAVSNNERSVEVDQYFKSVWGTHPLPLIGTFHTSATNHAGHALDVLRYAATLQGNYARALQTAQSMAAAHAMLAMNPRQQRPPAIWLVQKAFGKWNQLLAEPKPPEDRKYLMAVWHFVRGSAFVGRGEISNAEGELESLKVFLKDDSLKDVLSGANPARAILEIITHGLSGEIALSREQNDEAIRSFKSAVELQDTLNFNEPPDWAQSMRLYLGAAFLKAGRPIEAEAIYREELRDFQENGWALFGLAKSLQAQGKNAEAQKTQARFEQAWKNADVVLTSSVF